LEGSQNRLGKRNLRIAESIDGQVCNLACRRAKVGLRKHWALRITGGGGGGAQQRKGNDVGEKREAREENSFGQGAEKMLVIIGK